jgi:hypothetical protein
MESIRKWADLSAEEEEQKLLQIGELLQACGIEKEVTPLSADHQTNLLKSAYTNK